MKRNKTIALLLALLLALGLLTGCGAGENDAQAPGQTDPQDPAVSAPGETAEPAEPAGEIPEGAVEVSTVDELLAAIGSDTTILLRAGDYDLSAAADYAVEDLRGAYHWELVYGGAQLVLEGLTDLRLVGQGEVRILATPRFAEVLSLRDCWGVTLEGLTLGHTQDPGPCAAGVLSLFDCEDVTAEGCRLFGCGSMGVTATECERVSIRQSQIDSCSMGAVSAYSCEDLRVDGCSVLDCGLGDSGPAGSLFFAERCRGFALLDTQIRGNKANVLLNNIWSDQTVMLGCQVESSRFSTAMFEQEGRSVTIDGCSFQRRSGESYYRDSQRFALSPDGEELLSFDLDRMEHAPASYDGPKEPQPLQKPQATVGEDGRARVEVATVEELLSAIAPDTTIVLAPGVYDLSQAEGYGRLSGEFWDWDPVYDGYSLTLRDISGLCIQGAGKDETQILVEPRYAAVFSLQGCEDITLSGFTAGHSPEPGSCAGNVIDLESCRNVEIADCGLFGCGVIGVWAWGCDGIDLRDTEIYDCSSLAASLTLCSAVAFTGCSVHDCDDGLNDIYSDSPFLWDGEELPEGMHYFDGGIYLHASEADG